MSGPYDNPAANRYHNLRNMRSLVESAPRDVLDNESDLAAYLAQKMKMIVSYETARAALHLAGRTFNPDGFQGAAV